MPSIHFGRLQGLPLPAPHDDQSSFDIRLLDNLAGPDGGPRPDCIVCPAADGCLVSGSTRAPGAVYQTAQIGGTDHRVRYSGPDATPEKFAVLPAEAGAAIDVEVDGRGGKAGQRAVAPLPQANSHCRPRRRRALAPSPRAGRPRGFARWPCAP